MCCAREKAFCVDDRELMMFVCRWNDSLMCCQIDNANDKMFFGVPGASESGLYHLFVFMPSPMPIRNAQINARHLVIIN